MSKVRLLSVVVLILIVVGVFMGLSSAQGPSSSTAALRGAVKSSDGKPLEGVIVSARAEAKTFTTSVYTDRSGGYLFPTLEDGQYQLWAQAVGFETGRATAKLSSTKAPERNFAMKPLQDFSKQLSGVEWIDSLSDATPEDRRGKRLLGVTCNVCHSMGTVLQNRFDAAGWMSIVNLMEKINDIGVVYADNHSNPYVRAYKDEIVAYLTRVRGPQSAPLKYKPFRRPAGEATQLVVTEYDIPPGHDPNYVVFDNGTDWSQGVPSKYESRSAHDAIVDQHGIVWFTDQINPKRSLGKLDPTTGRVTDYSVMDKDNIPVKTHDIDTDQMGNVWVNSMSEGIMMKFDPKTEKFQKFPVQKPLPASGQGLLHVDSKGNIWESVQGGGSLNFLNPNSSSGEGDDSMNADPKHPGGAMRLDPKTGAYTFFPAITPNTNYYGVVIDSEDNAWFTQPGHDRLGVVDAKTGKVGEVILPPIKEDDVRYTDKDREIAAKYEAWANTGPPWMLGPRRGAADKTGNTIWHGASHGNRLIKIDIHTHKVTEYVMPIPYIYPYGVGVDKNHMVWVSSNSADLLFRFNPFTVHFTTYTLPTRGVDCRYISVDNSTDPPTLWLPYWGASKIARIQFRKAIATQAATR